MEKTVEHESNDYTNCNWCFWYSHQRIIKISEGLGNKWTCGDHPHYCIIEMVKILKRVLETWGVQIDRRSTPLNELVSNSKGNYHKTGEIVSITSKFFWGKVASLMATGFKFRNIPSVRLTRWQWYLLLLLYLEQFLKAWKKD